MIGEYDFILTLIKNISISDFAFVFHTKILMISSMDFVNTLTNLQIDDI